MSSLQVQKDVNVKMADFVSFRKNSIVLKKRVFVIILYGAFTGMVVEYLATVYAHLSWMIMVSHWLISFH